MKINVGLKWWSTIAALTLIVTTATLCQSDPSETPVSDKQIAYWGHGDSVHYVGIETCKSCHSDIYESYIQTGMGQSYDHAHPRKSKASFHDHPPVYDSELNLYYKAYWTNDTLYVTEYRLSEDGDTTHLIKQRIDHVIGSGQHTNSHIFAINDHYFQAPITWYVQESIPDLPPGYENGANSRFSRIIGLECMSCHNAMPTGFVKGSENKFTRVPQGIDCERCHGPGSAHVAKIQRGEITDTANDVDYSIVNPAKLSAQLRFELCSRCHLQGNAVLQENASFFDFLPGMHLKDVMDVYAPRYENDSSSFIMASHVDRFKMSQCYQSAPESYVCTSCHNPHKSVKITGSKVFNNTCTDCHSSSKDVCSEDVEKRQLVDNNCVGCHMPTSGSSDIPHVFVHDHYVRKDYSDTIQHNNKANKVFSGLVAINNPKPDIRSRINAYLQQYERFDDWPFLLDSAFHLLQTASKDSFPHEWIQYYFLKTNFRAVTNHHRAHFSDAVTRLNKQDFSNRDAWTAYRLAESYNQIGQTSPAQIFIDIALRLAPYQQDFLQKAAVISIKLKRYEEAEAFYKSITELQPYDPITWNNIGYLYQLTMRQDSAMNAYKQAIHVDPDYLPAHIKLAGIYYHRSQFAKALEILKRAHALDPNNQDIKREIHYLEQDIKNEAL
jgi:tetratricopeptide (TPR) repeat protein